MLRASDPLFERAAYAAAVQRNDPQIIATQRARLGYFNGSVCRTVADKNHLVLLNIPLFQEGSQAVDVGAQNGFLIVRGDQEGQRVPV